MEYIQDQDPVTAVKLARNYHLFAWFLHDAALKGSLTPDNLPPSLGNPNEGPLIQWQPPLTQEDLCAWTGNSILASIAISAQAVDRALDDTFDRGMKRPRDRKPLPDAATLSDIDALRTVMYMIRSTFAHNPFNPTWRCQRPKYWAIFTIRHVPGMAEGFQLNGPSLHKQPFDFAHFGGDTGYLHLLDLCLTYVEDARRGARVSPPTT